MARVVHFEIHAEDIDRAKEFYGSVFDWNFRHWGGSMEYWVIETGPDSEPGINGGLLPRREMLVGEAVTAFVCTVDVKSIDSTLDKVVAGGGTIALPTMAVPGLGWLAYCKDTEGNIFGLLQADPTAE